MRAMLVACLGLVGCGAVSPVAAPVGSVSPAPAIRPKGERDSLARRHPQPPPIMAPIPYRLPGVTFLKSQSVHGLARICVYDRLGSPYVVTLGMADICPVTLP